MPSFESSISEPVRVELKWITIPRVLLLFCLNHGLRMMVVEAVWSFHDLFVGYSMAYIFFLTFVSVDFEENFIHLRHCYSSLRLQVTFLNVFSSQVKHVCSANYGKMSSEEIRFHEEILKQAIHCITLKFLLMSSVCASFKIRYVLQKAFLYINRPRDG